MTSGGVQINFDKVSLTSNSGTQAVIYYQQDHLSNRLATDSGGHPVAQMGHYPFGESWYNTSGDKLFFTSYERDSESGNDYAMMRYGVNRLARFSSPDPLSGSLGNPQSLNKYTYTQNDPGNLVDPTGMFYGPCGPFDLLCPAAGPGLRSFWGGGDGSSASEVPLIFGSGVRGGGGGGEIGVGPIPVKGPTPPPGYEQCIMEALQEVIAYAEGTDRGKLSPAYDGYGLLVYGTVYSAPQHYWSLAGKTGTRGNPIEIDPATLSGHPGIQVLWNPNYKTSSAFGRYQITVGTAADPRFNITDFSPRGQDAGVETIMQSLNMLAPAMQGNLSLAMTRGNGVWASLPGANAPGQSSINMATAQSVFNNALQTLPDCQ